jgi:Holliday junction resolvasome RuvABC endonuclease subunit
MKILTTEKFSSRSTKFVYQEVEHPIVFGDNNIVIGIDPGNKNMGVSVLRKPSLIAHCYEIVMPSERMAIPRIVQVRLAMMDVFYREELYSYTPVDLVVVEGSSFGSFYRNTELAEARIAAACHCLDNLKLTQNQFEFVAPLKVRKLVFGNAKTRAENEWEDMQPDAASSLAVAIAGLMIRNNSLPEK